MKRVTLLAAGEDCKAIFLRQNHQQSDAGRFLEEKEEEELQAQQ